MLSVTSSLPARSCGFAKTGARPLAMWLGYRTFRMMFCSPPKDAVLYFDHSVKSKAQLSQAGYHGWRVESLSHAQGDPFGDTAIVVYNLNYELRATHPEQAVRAGSISRGTAGICRTTPTATGCFFGAGRKTGVLKEEMFNDGSPGTEPFDSEVRSIALDTGIISMTLKAGI